jgi:hypothetical protein
MNELMQQTLAGLPAHDRRLVRESAGWWMMPAASEQRWMYIAAARIKLRKCRISECSSLACDAARKLLAGQVFSATSRPLQQLARPEGLYEVSGSRSNARQD